MTYNLKNLCIANAVSWKKCVLLNMRLHMLSNEEKSWNLRLLWLYGYCIMYNNYNSLPHTTQSVFVFMRFWMLNLHSCGTPLTGCHVSWKINNCGKCWKVSLVCNDHKSADITETRDSINLRSCVVYLNYSHIGQVFHNSLINRSVSSHQASQQAWIPWSCNSCTCWG